MLDLLSEAKILLSIKGIGKCYAAIFLGELGDAKNFMYYRQIVKYADYDPVKKDFGSKIGWQWISKKGRHLFRKFLYFMAMRVIHCSPYFQAYYQREKRPRTDLGTLAEKRGPLCVVIKLIKVIFSLLRNQREFQELSPARMPLAAQRKNVVAEGRSY